MTMSVMAASESRLRMPIRTWTGSDRVGQMPKPLRPAALHQFHFAAGQRLGQVQHDKRLVMFEVTVQPIAMTTASRSAFSWNA